MSSSEILVKYRCQCRELMALKNAMEMVEGASLTIVKIRRLCINGPLYYGEFDLVELFAFESYPLR